MSTTEFSAIRVHTNILHNSLRRRGYVADVTEKMRADVTNAVKYEQLCVLQLRKPDVFAAPSATT